MSTRQRRWLLLDYAGVISHQPTGADWAALRHATGWTSHHQLDSAYWTPRAAYDLGELSPDQYWQRVLPAHRAPDRGVLRQLMKLDTDMWLRAEPKVLAGIGHARRHGAGVAILSNMPAPIARAIDATAWARLCRPRLFSCDLHAAKPSAEAFHTALDQLRTGPDQVVFVDDRADNVAAARRLGIPSLLYDSPTTIVDALNRLTPSQRSTSETPP